MSSRLFVHAPLQLSTRIARPGKELKMFLAISRFAVASAMGEEQDFQAWHRSHAYRDSHVGMPKGLKLDPERTTMMYFQVVAQ